MPASIKPSHAPNVQLVSLDEIDEGPNALRLDLGKDTPEMGELIESIRQFGVLQPVGLVKSGSRYQQVFGFRRSYAARQAGQTYISANVFENFPTDFELRAIQIQENVQRIDVEPIRFAEVLKEMIQQAGCTQQELARRVNLHPVRVSRLLRLAEQSDEVKMLVAAKRLPVSTALELAQLDPPARSDLFAKALAGELTRDSLIERRKSAARTRPAMSSATGRVAFRVNGHCTLSLAGVEKSFGGVIAALKDALTQARKAQADKLSLATFARNQFDRHNARS
jgi:ParB family chromosome partitioning protein